MPKVTLDMHTFKALASDTRLDILRVLDGKKMSLKEIEKATKLNKATLHEHLQKLNEAGLVKRKERDGHKWVYYKLTWKGEGLLHPENTKIVVMFSITFVSLLLAVMLLISFSQPIIVGMARTCEDTTLVFEADNEGLSLLSRSVNYNLVGEVKSENQSVEELTNLIQLNAAPKNAFGQSLSVSDIRLSVNGIDYDEESFICFAMQAPSFENITNLSQNKSIIANETSEDNVTNDSVMTGGLDNSYWESRAPVTEFIATFQDISFLYMAIVCLTFFGMLFTYSSWRLWKNRIPRL